MGPDEFLRRLEEFRQAEAARSEEQSSSYQLLPGEDPASPYPEDAQQWATVYRELVNFKDELVGQLQAKQEALSPAASAELHKDEVALQAELDRLRLHLQYWEECQQNAVPKSQSGMGALMEPELAIKVVASAAETLEVQTVLNTLERSASDGGVFRLEPGEQVQVGLVDTEDDRHPVRGALVVKLNEQARPSGAAAWFPLAEIAEAGLHVFQLEEG